MDLIYLLKDSLGYYKIGFTKNSIETRIKQLQTGNSGNFEIIFTFKTKHNRKLETSLHNMFKYKHVNREFYELNLEDEEKFKKLCESLELAYDVKQKFY